MLNSQKICQTFSESLRMRIHSMVEWWRNCWRWFGYIVRRSTCSVTAACWGRVERVDRQTCLMNLYQPPHQPRKGRKMEEFYGTNVQWLWLRSKVRFENVFFLSFFLLSGKWWAKDFPFFSHFHLGSLSDHLKRQLLDEKRKWNFQISAILFPAFRFNTTSIK